MPSSDLLVRYVGHATVLLELDGVRVLTDPFLRHAIGPIRRVVPDADSALLGDIDLVLISHAHLDHLDVPSLRLLGPRPRLIVPEGTGDRIRAACDNEIVEVTVGHSVAQGPLTVTATPAVHDLPRVGPGRRTQALGYRIDGSQGIYFAGDTDVFLGMADLSIGLDLALLPVWGWGPRLGPGHMDPRRAAEAAALLRPRVAIPIHWGTLWPAGLRRVAGDRLSRPPVEFSGSAADLAPDTRALILQPGETAELPAADETQAGVRGPAAASASNA